MQCAAVLPEPPVLSQTLLRLDAADGVLQGQAFCTLHAGTEPDL
jgi:hypothetical protein